jgi:hypothetical protein
VGSDNRSTTDHIFLRSSDTGEKNGNTMIQYFKKTYDSVRREVLYNILADFGVPMKLLRLTEMCLNETCSKLCLG